MDRTQVIRRLKAARALAGFSTPKALSEHPLLKDNDIKDSRLRELESIRGRAVARPMELNLIAKACGLPGEFFTDSFDRMASPSERELIERLTEEVHQMLDLLSASRMRQAVRGAAQEQARRGDASQGGRRATDQIPGRKDRGV